MKFFGVEDLTSSVVSPTEASAPPAPCKIKLIRSEVQNSIVYVLAFSLERPDPNRITIRERQRYMPADMKAGAIVRKIRYRMKLFLMKGESCSMILVTYPTTSRARPRNIANVNPQVLYLTPRKIWMGIASPKSPTNTALPQTLGR